MSSPALKLVKSASRPSTWRDAPGLSGKETPESPVFCFSAQQLAARARLFIDNFPGKVTYAVKCNASAPVLRTLARAGIRTWDVASVHEMRAVRAVSASARFHYHNPVKSRREIEEAAGMFGCRRFAVDCEQELRKIADVIRAESRIEIAVRFVLPRDRTSSAHDFSTKFGAPEHAAVGLLKLASELGFTPLLTFHPGSQSRSPDVYVRHIEAAARIAEAAGIGISKLNVGGGFPADYLRSTAPPATVFFSAISEAVARAFAGRSIPALECEPGRGLAATCMSLLACVKLVDNEDIFINDGVYGGLMEFMQVPELMPPYRAIRNGTLLAGPTKSFKVFGPTCDPLDVLPARLELPGDLREGDYIEFGTLGAYGLATATTFNGYGNHAICSVDTVLTC